MKLGCCLEDKFKFIKRFVKTGSDKKSGHCFIYGFCRVPKATIYILDHERELMERVLHLKDTEVCRKLSGIVMCVNCVAQKYFLGICHK